MPRLYPRLLPRFFIRFWQTRQTLCPILSRLSIRLSARPFAWLFASTSANAKRLSMSCCVWSTSPSSTSWPCARHGRTENMSFSWCGAQKTWGSCPRSTLTNNLHIAVGAVVVVIAATDIFVPAEIGILKPFFTVGYWICKAPTWKYTCTTKYRLHGTRKYFTKNVNLSNNIFDRCSSRFDVEFNSLCFSFVCVRYFAHK